MKLGIDCLFRRFFLSGNGQADQLTDGPSYRDASTHLIIKITIENLGFPGQRESPNWILDKDQRPTQ